MSTLNKTLLSRIGASCAHWFERFVSRDKHAWVTKVDIGVTQIKLYPAEVTQIRDQRELAELARVA